MPRFIYSPEMLAFIAASYRNCSVDSTTYLFNAAFGTQKTAKQIKAVIKNNKFTCGRTTGALNKGRFLLFSAEQIEYIKAAYQHHSIIDVTQKLNAQFGTAFTTQQVKTFTKNHGITSGRTGHFAPGAKSWNAGLKGWCAGGKSVDTQFKKGVTPTNHRPVGSERIDNKDGYISIKVAEPNQWALKHRVVWESVNGPVPKDMTLWFRDNDRLNCDPDNLMLVTRAQNAVVNKLGLSKLPADSKQTAVLLADISMKKKARAAA